MTNHHAPKEPLSCEEITRRNFLKGLFVTVGGFMTLSLSWPFLSFLVPVNNGGNDFIKIPNFKDVPVEKPTKMNFEYIDQQAFLKRKVVYDVWVIKHAEDKATVYTPLCPHLGCHYEWEGDKNRFMCPCHNSAFKKDGAVLGGPTPRALDTLPYKIQGGDLFVKWELYKPGIAAKVQA